MIHDCAHMFARQNLLLFIRSLNATMLEIDICVISGKKKKMLQLKKNQLKKKFNSLELCGLI